MPGKNPEVRHLGASPVLRFADKPSGFLNAAPLHGISSDSAPGTCRAVQLVPPSTVIRYVPRVPLAQATRSLTAAMPRSEAVVPLVCGVQDCAAATKPGRLR